MEKELKTAARANLYRFILLSLAPLGGLLIWLVLVNANTSDKTTDWARQSSAVGDALRQLRYDVGEAELDQRSYFLSQDGGYLAAFEKVSADITATLNQLDNTTDYHLAQHIRAQILRPLMEARILGLKRGIAAWQAGQHDLAIAYLRDPSDRRLSAEVKSWADVMLAEQRQIFRDHLALVNRDAERLQIFLVAGIVIITIAIVCVLVLLLRDLARNKALNLSLTQLKEEAEAANRAKSEYLAFMSHEVRTPLSGILGMTGLLMDTTLERLQQHYARAVQVSAESMLKIVNDILDISKLEADRLDFESIEFELGETIDRAIEAQSVLAAGKGIVLAAIIDPSLPFWITGDPSRLRQVLLNLLSNAVKFTETGHVLLEATRCDPGSAINGVEEIGICFSISDTGPGISESDLKHLFQKYGQLDTSIARRYGGTGLGLAISYRLVRLMGSEIEVTSTAGAGTTFKFTATFDAASQDAPVAQGITAQQLFSPELMKGRRVLVVDDNPIYRRAMETSLRVFSCDVRSAGSAEEALRMLEPLTEKDAFDLLVLCDRVAGEDGIDLANRLRGMPGLTGAKVIMMSMIGAPDPRTAAKARGIDDVLVKPVKRSSLAASLFRVFLSEEKPVFSQPLSEANAPAVKPLTILLAEDNEVNQLLVESLLARGGHRTTVAPDGEVALREALDVPYDLILMDIEMPLLDGIEATRLIRRSDGPNAKTPIIALTAHAEDETRREMLASGMQECLIKPIQPDRLYAAVTELAAAKPESAAQTLSGTLCER